MIPPQLYFEARQRLAVLGYGGDREWAENVRPPATAEDLAREYAWVVLNSGMKNTVARGIMDRVWPALDQGRRVREVFGHPGKAAAIELFWQTRAARFEELGLQLRLGPAAVLAWCESQPWIGKITKYHLAKNLGADVAKPDRWLVRLADASGESVERLCQRLAITSGDRVATVDVVLWRACAIGVLRPAPGGAELAEA